MWLGVRRALRCGETGPRHPPITPCYNKVYDETKERQHVGSTQMEQAVAFLDNGGHVLASSAPIDRFRLADVLSASLLRNCGTSQFTNPNARLTPAVAARSVCRWLGSQLPKLPGTVTIPARTNLNPKPLSSSHGSTEDPREGEERGDMLLQGHSGPFGRPWTFFGSIVDLTAPPTQTTGADLQPLTQCITFFSSLEKISERQKQTGRPP